MPGSNLFSTETPLSAVARLIGQVGFPAIIALCLLYVVLSFVPAINTLNATLQEWEKQMISENEQIMQQHDQIIAVDRQIADLAQQAITVQESFVREYEADRNMNFREEKQHDGAQ